MTRPGKRITSLPGILLCTPMALSYLEVRKREVRSGYAYDIYHIPSGIFLHGPYVFALQARKIAAEIEDILGDTLALTDHNTLRYAWPDTLRAYAWHYCLNLNKQVLTYGAYCESVSNPSGKTERSPSQHAPQHAQELQARPTHLGSVFGEWQNLPRELRDFLES